MAVVSSVLSLLLRERNICNAMCGGVTTLGDEYIAKGHQYTQVLPPTCKGELLSDGHPVTSSHCAVEAISVLTLKNWMLPRWRMAAKILNRLWGEGESEDRVRP